MPDFIHLHVHTQYSILDGLCDIPVLIAKARQNGMRAIAITDHGNMFGAKVFYNEAKKQKIKPILGCEAYVAKRRLSDKNEKEDRKQYHLIILAKNLTGYHNLVKLVSYAYIKGFYYKPRIDRELLLKYHEGLIVSTACLAGEIPQAILNGDIEKAEKVILEYKNVFHDDFYLELMRHKTNNKAINSDVFEKQQIVNDALIGLSKKTGVKLIATNDVHFVNAEDAEAHDRLVCLNTGKYLDDVDRLHYTKQEFFKTQQQMNEIFSDIPEAIENTNEVADKVEEYELNHKPILPDFPIPDNFDNADNYLKHLTYKGAERRYNEITSELKERIDFELSTISKMGFAGYFLIVQDFLNKARNMGVSVGPGRGSAAGSVVAFCINITDIDPIKYKLLFERFLNPDRISMPDIDIDFDEDGRSEVLDWVANKYGKNKVAHIITFGTMAAKMAIRDVARVQRLPLPEADKLAKLVPDIPKITLKNAYKQVSELRKAKNSNNKLIAETLKYAEELEGSVRHTGIHACGIIIGKDDLIEHIPLCISKETKLLVTQYDGSHVEEVGMLKMDFLGLKTLSIIKDTIKNIKLSKNIDIVIEEIPFDDKETYELFTRGDTTGVFQFESEGMKKYLKDLQPNRFEDLIAMNALYRPGPMEYIPSYIRRKHNEEPIVYDHPLMKQYLEDTYGITVYQEQVMQISRAMAGFTRGEADSLRKAMGKKKKKVMDVMKEKFDEGCKKNNIDEKIYTKVWNDWGAFSKYAFNKSHSTCYAYISYKMAYLKMHYPAEFMAAVLSRNINDIKKITFFIEECKRHNISVLGPDVNESELRFTVNKKGEIRFGLEAIKGVGEAAANELIEERKNNGLYKDFFDMTKRVNLRSVNKRALESLASAGAFDSFGAHRAQYFYKENEKDTEFIEKIIKHAGIFQNRKNSLQKSLFGDIEEIKIENVKFPECDEWSKLEKLKKEKQVTGFYISGHPLDNFKIEINNFCNVKIIELKNNLELLKNRNIAFAGIITKVAHKSTKNGTPFASFIIEDLSDSMQLAMFSEDYLKMRHFLVEGTPLFIRARVRNRYNSMDQFEVKINEVNLLSEILNKFTKNITLMISLSDINEDKIKNISNLVLSHKGKCKLKFQINDFVNKISLVMPSKKYKVNCSEFIKSIENFQNIKYKLN